MIYRRRYKCPECGGKGRHSFKARDEDRVRCAYCHTWLLLEEQNEDGTGYRKENLLADWNYEI